MPGVGKITPLEKVPIISLLITGSQWESLLTIHLLDDADELLV